MWWTPTHILGLGAVLTACLEQWAWQYYFIWLICHVQAWKCYLFSCIEHIYFLFVPLVQKGSKLFFQLFWWFLNIHYFLFFIHFIKYTFYTFCTLSGLSQSFYGFFYQFLTFPVNNINITIVCFTIIINIFYLLFQLTWRFVHREGDSFLILSSKWI